MTTASAPTPYPSAVPMRGEFRTGSTRFVEHMGFLEVSSFVGEGVGAALYLLGVYTNQRSIVALGVGFVALAVVALLSHLGTRAHLGWRALARIRTSWVSRGSLFISVFMALAVPALGAAYIDALAPLQKPLTVGALVFAPLVILYAGMMLRSMKAVTLWRNALVPLAFIAHSLSTALVIVWAMAQAAGWDLTQVAWLRPAAIGGLLLAAGLSAVHLLSATRTAAIKASLDRLFAGSLRATSIGGAGVAGLAVPLAVLLAGVGGPLLAVLAALCRLFGDYAYRLSVVKAGAYEPIVPPLTRRL